MKAVLESGVGEESDLLKASRGSSGWSLGNIKNLLMNMMAKYWTESVFLKRNEIFNGNRRDSHGHLC